MFSPATDPPQSIMYYQSHQTDDHLHPMPPLILATHELPNFCAYSSSGCESSPNGYSALLPENATFSGTGGLARKSISSRSLLVIPPLMNDSSSNHTGAYNYQSAVNVMGSDVHRLVDLIDSFSVRRAVSTGDLQLQVPLSLAPHMLFINDRIRDLTVQMQHQQYQQQHGTSSSKESSSSSIIEGVLNKACRYSPEEKKERIERYKTKRGNRNFNKKIKYACRKTLADSRPRIRGRFARNNSDNNNEDDDNKWGGHGCHDADDKWENNEDDNWLDLFNAAW